MEYVAVFSDGSRRSTLAHHGIKNQKWGIRRFQNEDGTLTPAGIERYRKMKKPSFETHYNPATVGAGVVAGFKTGGPLGGVVGGLAATAATGATYALAKHRYDKYEKAYNKTVDKSLGKLADLDKMEREDSTQLYNWKDPKATVKQLAKLGYSVGEIAADLPFDLTESGKEEEYVRKILGQKSAGESNAKPSKRWEDMSSKERAAASNRLTDAMISGKKSEVDSEIKKYRDAAKNPDYVRVKDKQSMQKTKSADEYFNSFANDPDYIRVKDKQGNDAFVKITNKKTAEASLSYLGYNTSEIAKILGMSEEQVRKMRGF